MAKKGQKYNKYSKEIKEEILKKYYNGEGNPTSLSKEYNMSFHTIRTWIDKKNNPQRFPGAGKKQGRPKGSINDWKEKYEILKKYQAFLKAQRERK